MYRYSPLFRDPLAQKGSIFGIMGDPYRDIQSVLMAGINREANMDPALFSARYALTLLLQV